LDPTEAEWIDALVQLLEENGYRKAARSEVVRMAVLELRDTIRGKTPADIVRYFAQRDADRVVAALVDRGDLSLAASHTDDEPPTDGT
jgi:hypothetical protein